MTSAHVAPAPYRLRLSIVVLALITYFLFREGAGFFGQNRQNLEVYRRAGLEYVDFIRAQTENHTALTHYLADVRLRGEAPAPSAPISFVLSSSTLLTEALRAGSHHSLEKMPCPTLYVPVARVAWPGAVRVLA